MSELRGPYQGAVIGRFVNVEDLEDGDRLVILEDGWLETEARRECGVSEGCAKRSREAGGRYGHSPPRLAGSAPPTSTSSATPASSPPRLDSVIASSLRHG
jgi:hypothetical protein